MTQRSVARSCRLSLKPQVIH